MRIEEGFQIHAKKKRPIPTTVAAASITSSTEPSAEPASVAAASVASPTELEVTSDEKCEKILGRETKKIKKEFQGERKESPGQGQ